MEKRETQLSRVRPASLAFLEGTFGLIAGAVIAILAWISTSVGFDLNTDTVLQGLMLGMTPGLAAVIGLAIAYSATGFIVGYMHGALYNLMTRWSEQAAMADEGGAGLEDAQIEAAAERAVGRRYEPTFGETIGPRKRDK